MTAFRWRFHASPAEELGLSYGNRESHSLRIYRLFMKNLAETLGLSDQVNRGCAQVLFNIHLLGGFVESLGQKALDRISYSQIAQMPSTYLA